ncbi:MAG: hypothetical protein ABSE73_32610 [Planctomycetota bacterium]
MQARALARPSSFEGVFDALKEARARTIHHIVRAQNRVHKFLHKAGELKQLGFSGLMDRRQVGRFCVYQVCKDWECCSDLVKAVRVGGSWCPTSRYAGGCMEVSAYVRDAALSGVIYVLDISEYARTLIPSFAMDIALSVRNAVDCLAVVDCKASELDLRGRAHSKGQECMLLGILIHPDRQRYYNWPILVPLATWPMVEYD